jgi:signal transduction histidine kinase
MARDTRKSLSYAAVAAYSAICLALLLLVGVSVWDVCSGRSALRQAALDKDLSLLRSHAERTVGRIERDLETNADLTLAAIHDQGWLRDYWDRAAIAPPEHSFFAIVDDDRRIVVHSNPSREGRQLSRHWYDRRMMEAGEDVVLTSSAALAVGGPAVDVLVPIRSGTEIGQYHAGFSLAWFEQQVQADQERFMRRQIALLAGMLLVVLSAGIGLYYIATHSIMLRKTVDVTLLERATEVGRLVAGLAHEIRNPLHAMQLNLHVLRKAQDREHSLTAAETNELLAQCSREIGRIEQLMQQLLGFATPSEPRQEIVDLASELRAVVEFLDAELQRNNVQIETRWPAQSLYVQIDHGRLRQIMLNLLQNAEQSMTGNGRIRLGLVQRRDMAEICVADSGPGIAEVHRERIFDPFFSTRQGGTGLGLALVKRFVTEVGGQIDFFTNDWGGTTFRVLLPTVRDLFGKKVHES